jgi:predicted PurR-regulated permease PerM
LAFRRRRTQRATDTIPQITKAGRTIIAATVGVALIPIGLLLLGGWQGNLTGIIVAVFALLPIVTSVTGFCPLYIPFGISTLGKEQRSTKIS